jgi:hypothetical protein
MVSEIQELSKLLSRALRLQPGEKPLPPRKGKKDTSAFLFEMKVLFGLLLRLRRNGWDIQIVRPYNDGKVSFVRNPAKKTSGTYFIISKDGLVFHLVHGTKIQDMHGEPRAPDISLQLPQGGDSPTYADVLAMWDAKLRGTNAGPAEERISDNEYARFAKVREWLQLPRPGTPNDTLDLWPPAFEVSGLISNGRRNTEPETIYFADAVSVVEHYDGPSKQCYPSRQQHINHSRPKRKQRNTIKTKRSQTGP